MDEERIPRAKAVKVPVKHVHKISALSVRQSKLRSVRKETETRKLDIQCKRNEITTRYVEDVKSALAGNPQLLNAIKNDPANDAFFRGASTMMMNEEFAPPVASNLQFWYQTLARCTPIAGCIFKKDLPLLQALSGITVRSQRQNHHVELVFSFNTNSYFTNTEVVVTLEVARGKVHRVLVPDINWKSQDQQKRFHGPYAMSVFRMFRNVDRRTTGIFNLAKVAAFFTLVKNLYLRYFGATHLLDGRHIPAYEEADKRNKWVSGWDSLAKTVGQQVEATRKDEQMKELNSRRKDGFGGGFGGMGRRQGPSMMDDFDDDYVGGRGYGGFGGGYGNY